MNSGQADFELPSDCGAEILALRVRVGERLTGYTRKYALTLLSNPPPDEHPIRRTRPGPPSYGPLEVQLLRLCWLMTDGIA